MEQDIATSIIVNLLIRTFNVSLIWQAVKNQGKRFHERGVPIHGIGVQSHLRDGDVDITAIKVRH